MIPEDFNPLHKAHAIHVEDRGWWCTCGDMLILQWDQQVNTDDIEFAFQHLDVVADTHPAQG